MLIFCQVLTIEFLHSSMAQSVWAEGVSYIVVRWGKASNAKRGMPRLVWTKWITSDRLLVKFRNAFYVAQYLMAPRVLPR